MRDDNKVMNIIMIILFFVFLGLIIWAQKTVSVRNLMIEIVGLTGLLTLLFLYNKNINRRMKYGRIIIAAC